jgi:hypothetical protein
MSVTTNNVNIIIVVWEVFFVVTDIVYRSHYTISVRNENASSFLLRNFSTFQSETVVSKRCLYLLRNADVLPFGQKEKLVTRLKGLLKDYPKDHSVLNELLQNADDAGATEIHFVYDLRQVCTDQFFDKKCKSLPTGPALCVYNNACFSQADISGDQRHKTFHHSEFLDHAL